jgi:hypothetical protein
LRNLLEGVVLVSRRVILFAVLAASLAGCSSEDFDRSSYERFSRQFVDKVKLLESERPGRGRAYAIAVLRLGLPPSQDLPSEDFDPQSILKVVTERSGEPPYGSDAFLRAVFEKSLPVIEGLGDAAVVDRFVAIDLQALNREDEWAKGYHARAEVRLRSAKFEKERRESLLMRVLPRNASYSWSEAGVRKPFVRFTLFNPLDQVITSIDLLIDLYDANGGVLTSTRTSYEFPNPLAPATEGVFALDVSTVAGFNDKRFMDLRDPLKVGVKVVDVYISNHLSVLGKDVEVDRVYAREKEVKILISRIADAKGNLAKFRRVFR